GLLAPPGRCPPRPVAVPAHRPGCGVAHHRSVPAWRPRTRRGGHDRRAHHRGRRDQLCGGVDHAARPEHQLREPDRDRVRHLRAHPRARPEGAPGRTPGVRALVTGGAGFIGSHITDALIDAGHTVTVIDDLSRGRRDQVNPGASFVELDITSPELTAAFAAARPDVVFHAAAQIDVRESVRNPLHDADVNVVGTVNVLRAALDAGAHRVVFASSGGAIYGDTDVIPTPEEHPCLPASPYGTAKLCAEA